MTNLLDCLKKRFPSKRELPLKEKEILDGLVREIENIPRSEDVRIMLIEIYLGQIEKIDRVKYILGLHGVHVNFYMAEMEGKSVIGEYIVKKKVE